MSPSGLRNRNGSVSYDETGVEELVVQMVDLDPALVLLEASGGLELPLVAALAAAALPVVVVNPRQVRDFARATGTLAKTDALDAAVLAHFADAVRPSVRPLRDAETVKGVDKTYQWGVEGQRKCPRQLFGRSVTGAGWQQAGRVSE